MGTVSTITMAIEAMKRLKELTDKTKNIEIKEQIVELRSALVDLKEELAELQERNLELEAALKEATEKPNLRQMIEVKDDVYYLKEAIDGRGTGPFCPACFEGDEKLVPLQKTTSSFTALGSLMCPACHVPYC